jgi:hypothetical protein
MQLPDIFPEISKTAVTSLAKPDKTVAGGNPEMSLVDEAVAELRGDLATLSGFWSERRLR